MHNIQLHYDNQAHHPRKIPVIESTELKYLLRGSTTATGTLNNYTH